MISPVKWMKRCESPAAPVIVVSAKAGVQVGTELAWEKAEKAGLPRMIFVNGMDEDAGGSG